MLQYFYDGQLRDISSRTVSAQQLQADGTVATVEHTFYFSHFGPIMDLGGRTLSLLAVGPMQWAPYLPIAMPTWRTCGGWTSGCAWARPQNLGEFKQALRDHRHSLGEYDRRGPLR